MNTAKRLNSFMPRGIPKYVRCYDFGEPDNDRYTIVFTGKYRKTPYEDFLYLGMGEYSGYYHGSHKSQIDVNKWGYAPAIGRKNHLGKRIRFEDLPQPCQTTVIAEYKDLWGLK